MSINANAINTDTNQNQNENTFIYRVEPRQLIEEIKHNLLGETLDPNTNNYIKSDTPLINKEGADAIATILRSHLNSAVVQGNTTEDIVYKICLQIKLSIVDLIYLKYQDFQLDFSNWDILIDSVDHPCFLFLSRTIEDKERIHHSTVTRFNESNIIREDAPKEKGISLPLIN